MRLTSRCIQLLTLLRATRWLTTSQVHRRFFPDVSLDAARKRLRKLTRRGYLLCYRENPMTEGLFTLGPQGKRHLEQTGQNEIVLERKPPKQREHFLAVNDVRLAAEAALPLRYFFAYWELPAAGWKHPLIPDFILETEDRRRWAGEFDRGLEPITYFIRTKIRVYERGLEGFPISDLLVIADRQSRMRSLARAISVRGLHIFYSSIDLIREHGILTPIFWEEPDGEGREAFSGSLLEVSSR
jgi:hypothetical protein